MSVVKQFYIGERVNLELRADMFNMFNNVQFQNPDLTISDANLRPDFNHLRPAHHPVGATPEVLGPPRSFNNNGRS